MKKTQCFVVDNRAVQLHVPVMDVIAIKTHMGFLTKSHFESCVFRSCGGGFKLT